MTQLLSLFDPVTASYLLSAKQKKSTRFPRISMKTEEGIANALLGPKSNFFKVLCVLYFCREGDRDRATGYNKYARCAKKED